MRDEEGLLNYLAAGGKLSAPDNATGRYRGELMRLMAIFVDSEMAGASGFADGINLAPGLKERITATRIVLEKFAHAEKVLTLMQQFGANTARYVNAHPWAVRQDRSLDLGTHRLDGDMRLNVFHYPLQGWLDAIAMNMLMGRATMVQLDELTDCSYQPLADTLMEILPVETHHAELGEEGVRKALQSGCDKTAVQASVNYWYPRVAATFGRAVSDHFEVTRKFGLRQHSNEALLIRWQNDTAAMLQKLNLTLPGQADET